MHVFSISFDCSNPKNVEKIYELNKIYSLFLKKASLIVGNLERALASLGSDSFSNSKTDSGILLKAMFIEVGSLLEEFLLQPDFVTCLECFGNYDEEGRRLGLINIRNINFNSSLIFAEDVLPVFSKAKASFSFQNCEFNESVLFEDLKENSFLFYSCKFPAVCFNNCQLFSLVGSNTSFEKLELRNCNVGNARFIASNIRDFFYTEESIYKDLSFFNIKNLKRIHIKSCNVNEIYVEKCSFSLIDIFNTGDESDIIVESADEALFYNFDRRKYNVIIEGKYIKLLNFTSSDFDNGIFLEKLSVENSIFNNSQFNDCTIFKEVNFLRSPKFHNVKLHQDTDFNNCNFCDTNSSDAWRNYRTLKLKMQELGSEHEAHNFHSLELQSRYNTVLPKWSNILSKDYLEKVCAFLMELFTDFNRDLWLPMLWLLLIGLIGLLYYLSFNAVECVSNIVQEADWLRNMCAPDKENLRSALYSLQQTLGPIGVLIQKDVFVTKTLGQKFFQIFHFLFSTLMLFFLLFGIRRRFKI